FGEEPKHFEKSKIFFLFIKILDSCSHCQQKSFRRPKNGGVFRRTSSDRLREPYPLAARTETKQMTYT
ncbi:hypothetical protein, partial [Geobacillus thermoleovorans]|uniref:hypothetical protein n=1 Tax=Geobacillus thermoleovorans TaxID=33941 RepID=UPI003DA2CDDE